MKSCNSATRYRSWRRLRAHTLKRVMAGSGWKKNGRQQMPGGRFGIEVLS